MKQFLFNFFKYSGLPFFFRKKYQKRTVTVLLYHDISPKIANLHFKYLNNNYNIISLNMFKKALKKKDFSKLPDYSLIITLDDGHYGNYSLFKLFIKHKMPATIFLASNIVATNRHYWFHYESHFNIDLTQISNDSRLEKLKEIEFEPKREYPKRLSLSRQEIEEMKKYLDFQSHTKFHPILPQCSDQVAMEEIKGSKTNLEKSFSLSIDSIAYPNGDYSNREIIFSKKAGYELGLTVDSGYNDESTNPFMIKRTYISDNANTNELIVRSSGLWDFLKGILKK